jgi:hypothetical protein
MTRPLFRTAFLDRALVIGALCGITLTLPKLAQAQIVDEFGSYMPEESRAPRESSRNFAFEVRFGPYLPRVDSEFSNGNTPFKDYYGTKDRFMLGAEFDWLPFTVPDVLRLGIGAGISYTTMSTKAPVHFDHREKSGQDTRLRVMPQWLVGVARVDVLNRRTSVPLVFVGKVGLANGMWWVADDPSPSGANGVKGRGMSQGIYYGVGVQLDLGFTDPYRKKRLDTFVGINNVYFFGELYGMELSSFGAADAMHVGDRSWVLGISMDF